MSRRIQTGYRVVVPTGEGKLSGEEGKSVKDDYIGRLAKYIPAEIVGLYLAASGIVPKTDTRATTALWWIFGVCFAFTPLYLIFVTRDSENNKGPLYPQVVLATIAFPVWVFAIGGPFATLSWYEGWIASLVLIFVTFAFGFKIPKENS